MTRDYLFYIFILVFVLAFALYSRGVADEPYSQKFRQVISR